MSEDGAMLDPHVSMDLTYLQQQHSGNGVVVPRYNEDEDDEDGRLPLNGDDEDIDMDMDGETEDTVADIDDLNRRLGDTLLENIHLKHEKRQSIAMAERWKTQAEKLQRKIAKTQDKLTKLSQQGVMVSIDDENESDDGNLDDVYDTEREKLKEKISELSKQVESLQLEYGDEVLTNIKLRREKRESVMLVERERGEKESLRRALSAREDAINQLTQKSLDSRLDAHNDDEEISLEQMSQMELQLAHRQSLQQIVAHREEAAALKKELDELKRREDGMMGDDGEGGGGGGARKAEDFEEKVRDLNLQLGDEVLANIRLKREKRQSLMVAKTYQNQLTQLQDEIVELRAENRRLELSKMQSVTNLTSALNESREIIGRLAKRLEKFEMR